MLYPDGSSVQAGDLIWWDEGHCVGFVQEVIETEADQRRWGLMHPHLLIGGHPYRPGAPGFVMCAATDLADEGIGRLTDHDAAQLDAAIAHAQAEAPYDLAGCSFLVQAEVCNGVQIAWLITASATGGEKGTFRIPVEPVDGT